MIGWISSLTPEEWTAIFTGIGALAIIIGSIIAIVNLRVISRTQHLESVREFIKDLGETAEDRKFIFQEFDFNLRDPKPLPYDVEKRVQNVINSLNRIGLLLENNLLSYKLVFSICHTMIIICWYKLENYVSYHEARIGGRYGRRLIRLVTRAKNYHDIHSQHRQTKIKIYQGTEKPEVTIHETKIEKGLKGIKQRVNWKIRRFLGIY